MNPKVRQLRVAPGFEAVMLAVEPTRWALLSRAVSKGPFLATESVTIAREDANFQGSDQTARDHAAVLEAAKLLERVSGAKGGIRYRATKEARRIHGHLVAAQGETADARSAAVGPLLALLARPGLATLDAIRLDAEVEYELMSALHNVLDGVEVEERARILTQPV
jgi:hypothetical protein